MMRPVAHRSQVVPRWDVGLDAIVAERADLCSGPGGGVNHAKCAPLGSKERKRQLEPVQRSATSIGMRGELRRQVAMMEARSDRACSCGTRTA